MAHGVETFLPFYSRHVCFLFTCFKITNDKTSNYKCSAVAEMGDRGHSRHGPKSRYSMRRGSHGEENVIDTDSVID